MEQMCDYWEICDIISHICNLNINTLAFCFSRFFTYLVESSLLSFIITVQTGWQLAGSNVSLYGTFFFNAVPYQLPVF